MAKQTPQYSELEEDYDQLLGSLTITKGEQLENVASRLKANRARYEDVSALTGVPWEFIAVIHYRESNLNFSRHLHNGDPLTARTKQVPRGRPVSGTPPFTWEESAVDALVQKGLDSNQDWSMPRMCYELERFNGFGYRLYHPSILSPYLWSGTNHYTCGKYVADGKFSKTTKDVQLGTVGLLKMLMVERPAKKNSEIVDSSRKLSLLQRLRNAIMGLAGSVLALDWLQLLGQVKQFTQDHAGLLLVVGAGSVWAIFKLIEGWSIQDYKEGRYTPSGEDKNVSS